MTNPAQTLGNAEFRKDHQVELAYIAGGMYHGIASKEMVIAMAKARLLSFFGAGGLSLSTIEKNIVAIKQAVKTGAPYGINFLHQFEDPSKEFKLVKLLFRHGVNRIEASAFVKITKALVYFRAKGLTQAEDGTIEAKNLIVAKVSRVETAKAFMQPPPEPLLQELVEEGLLSAEQSHWAQKIPMSHDICIEADSGGHTDGGNPLVLFPSISAVKTQTQDQYQYKKHIRLGLAGGIGTPRAAASAFILGADFILTGSINQCTVEANTTPLVKDMLQNMGIHDTTYAPAADMFELGSKVQVLKKGTLFPVRANKLHTLYSCYRSIDDIPEEIIRRLEKQIFKKGIDEVYNETKAYYEATKSANEISALENNKKTKMAAVFKWYFAKSSPLQDSEGLQKQDYQIHTGPAMGAFNLWVQETTMASWENRKVADVANIIMQKTSELLFKN